MNRPHVFASFGSPSAVGIAGMPFVAIGGTELLPQFFEQVAMLGGCREIWICSPFVDIEEKSLIPQLTALPHSELSLFFITANDGSLRSAWGALTVLPWQAFHFGIHEGWHAKIYLAVGKSGRICLIGSHNFTGAGASRNFEAGVLLVSSRADQVADAVYSVRTELEAALRRCRRVYDAVSRPNDII